MAFTLISAAAMSAATAGLVTTAVTVGWGTLLTAASVAYQVTQAKKMKAAARAAAEARAGQEMVIDGTVTSLPIVYGRALVGGSRVWHKTASNFKYQPSNAQVIFSVGPPATPTSTYTTQVYNETTGLYEEQTITEGGTNAGRLDKNYDSSKNQFLFYQQALCQAPINNVLDVIINNGSNLDEPTYGKADITSTTVKDLKAALRIDCHITGNPEPDAIMSANDASRNQAVFNGAAYASVAVKLNLGDPQFQGVPTMQFLVEGRPVGYFTGSSYSLAYNPTTKFWLGAKQYSTNPALCLLDYLIDNQCGKGLLPEQIDLPSFKAAADVCGTIVMTNATVGGQIWNPVAIPVDPSGNDMQPRRVSRRDIPLYECNMLVDTSATIRSNVENILATMGDARLVWSQGKYKLLVQYPATNEDINLAGTLTDDDLVMDDQLEIKWPSASERLNYATVRFHNEAMDFKEDSVSWPAKIGGIYSRGIGADLYPTVSGWDSNTGGNLLNTYGVWTSIANSTTLTWKFEVKNTGTQTLKFTGDDSVTIYLNNVLHATGNNWRNVFTTTFTATKNQIIEIRAEVVDTGGIKGFAGELTDASGVQVWTSRSPAYTDFITVDTNTQSDVYDTYLAEDQNLTLETDVFADGVTDYYHALAKAEELVRTSRSAFSISFKYQIKDKYFEPGDIIKVESSILGFEEGIFVRVNEATLEDGITCRIVGTRFDYTQLAWNVADDQIVRPNNPFDSTLDAPAWLEYSAESYKYAESAGTLNWGEVLDPRVVGYILYASKSDDILVNGSPNFFEVGRAVGTTFELPALSFAGGVFGVRAYSASGKQSAMTRTSGEPLIIGKTPPIPLSVTATSSTDKAEIVVSWYVNPLRGTGTIGPMGIVIPDLYDDHAVSTVWRSSTDNSTTAVQIGEVTSQAGNVSVYADTNEIFGPVYYWVKSVSIRGKSSNFSASAASEFNHFEGTVKDPTPPPAPYDLVVEEGYTILTLSWNTVTHNIGGGHSKSKVYAAEWVNDTTEPSFGSARLVAESIPNTYWFTGKPDTKYNFWVKSVSKGGGVSTSAAGPVSGRTAIDIGATIAAISGEIDESVLGQQLAARINLIDGIEAGSVNARLAGLSEDIAEGYSTKTQTSEGLTSAFASLKNAITNPNGGSVGAVVFDGYYTRASTDSAITTATTLLKSQIEAPNGDSIGATLVNSYYTKTSTDTAIANANTALKSQIESTTGTSIGATLYNSYYTKASTDSAISSQLQQFNTSLTNPDGSVRSASLQTLSEVVAGPGGLSAQYSLKLDVNGYVSGFGLYNNGATSVFGVNADSFWVGKSGVWTGGGNAVKPFIIQDGIVYIDIARIRDAAITSAKIGSVNADTITAGTITGRTLRTAASGNRIMIGDLGNSAVPNTIAGYKTDGSTRSFHFATNADSGAFNAGFYSTGFIEAFDPNNGYALITRGKTWHFYQNQFTYGMGDYGFFATNTNGNSYMAGGEFTGFTGVKGLTNNTGGYGVSGVTTSSYAIGTYGYSSSHVGVWGESSAATAAVVGNQTSSGRGGQFSSGSGVGCYGQGSIGVEGNGYSWDFYASGFGGNYGPFTGSHDIIMSEMAEIGDILIDSRVLAHRNVSNAISVGVVSSLPNQKASIGVFAGGKLLSLDNMPNSLINPSYPPTSDNLSPDSEAVNEYNRQYYLNSYLADYFGVYYRCVVNSVGEGQINVCGENGNLEAGDLITTSSIPGKGMKQADDIVRSYTVAKCRESVTFSSPTEVKMVACIYVCG